MQAPIPLAALHQITAVALFCAAVWHSFELRYARHRLIEIGDDVLDALDADGEPHDIRPRARGLALLVAQAGDAWWRPDG